MHKLSFIIVLLITSALACVDEPEEPVVLPAASSFELIDQKILKPSCALSGCHDGNAGSSHPKLTGINLYNEMVTDHVHNYDAELVGISLIRPFNVDSSFFFQKLIYEDSPFAFGSAMPAGGLVLSDNQIEFIRQWIEQGAPKVGHVVDQSLLD